MIAKKWQAAALSAASVQIVTDCAFILFELSILESMDMVRFCYTPQICHTPTQAAILVCRFLILINSVHKYGTLRRQRQLRSVESILLVHLIDRLILFGVAKKVPKAHRQKQTAGFQDGRDSRVRVFRLNWLFQS